MKQVNMLELRKRIGGIVDNVVSTKEPILVMRGSQPLVVMEPFEVFQERESHDEKAKGIRATMKEHLVWRAAHRDQLLPRGTASRIIREIRDSRGKDE